MARFRRLNPSTLLLVALALFSTYFTWFRQIQLDTPLNPSNPSIQHQPKRKSSFKFPYLYPSQSGEEDSSLIDRFDTADEVGLGTYHYKPSDLCIFIYTTPHHLTKRAWAVQQTWKRHVERLGARVYFIVPKETNMDNIGSQGPDTSVFSSKTPTHPFPLKNLPQSQDFYSSRKPFDKMTSFVQSTASDSEGKALKARTMQIWDWMYKAFTIEPELLKNVVEPFRPNDTLITKPNPRPKWFFKVDDDTFVNVENLLRQLSKFRATDQDFPVGYKGDLTKAPPAKPLFLGRKMIFNNGQGTFNSGGAGYILSQKALDQLFSSPEAKSKCTQAFNQGSIEGEDVLFARCLLQSIQLSPYDPTIFQDELYPNSTPPILSGFHWQKPEDLLNQEHFDPMGWTKWPVVYHWLPPQQMFPLYFFTYEMNFS